MSVSSKVFAPLVAVALFCALILPSQTAKADGMDGFYPHMILYVGGSLGVLSGVPGLIGNAVYLADGERSPLGWQIVGYIGGGLSVVGGVGGLVASQWSEEFALALGLTSLLLGTTEIVVTALAGTLPEAAAASPDAAPAEARYHLRPFVAPNDQGEPTYGLSLSILGF